MAKIIKTSVADGSIGDPSRITVQQKVLETFTLGYTGSMTNDFVHPDNIRSYEVRDDMLNLISMGIKVKLLGHKMHEENHTETVPLSWWDHLKQHLAHHLRHIAFRVYEWHLHTLIAAPNRDVTQHQTTHGHASRRFRMSV